MPGWIALNRIGASSVASVRIMLLTPPFTVVTVVEPGYGRSLARPPKSTTELSSESWGSRVEMVWVYPTTFIVARLAAPTGS